VSDEQQRRVALGVRYDATDHVSLKAEMSHINGLDGTAGLFSSAPTTDADRHVNLLRLSVDATF
jgi:hypothetical protein